MDVANWEEPDPGELFNPKTDADWNEVLKRYVGSMNDGPLLRCVQVARANGAASVVVETRYLGGDYRSEYTTFYSRIFASVPDSAHRIHFFDQELQPTQLGAVPVEVNYLGYVVVRPSFYGLVAKAVLKPPPEYALGVRVLVTDSVNLFGQRLEVAGAPFSQQDTRLGVCAHSSAWMCHEAAALRGFVHPRKTADFAKGADASLYPGRALPSDGLTAEQLSDLFRKFGLPPMFYFVGNLPHPGLPWQPPPPAEEPDRLPGRWDTRIVPTVCRHLNGGFPVLICTLDHAFILVGWYRDPTTSKVVLIRNDDQQGPYLPVTNPLDDQLVNPATGFERDYGPWRVFHVPVPDKAWLLPESAERRGGQYLLSASVSYVPQLATRGIQLESLQDLVDDNRLSIRTYIAASTAYKDELTSRGYDAASAAAYRLARMPKFVVVVEAIDRALRDAGQPSVVAEVLFDATSSDIQPDIIAARVHGLLTVQRTDRSKHGPLLTSASPVRTGGVGSP
jgi:hypothetical protein